MKKHGIYVERQCYHKCDICSQSFFSASILIRHKMKIHNIKSKCQWCVKTFTSLFRMKNHNNNYHSDYDSKIQKKFKCLWCIKTFTSSISMRSHVSKFHPEHQQTVHEGHKCIFCWESFAQS